MTVLTKAWADFVIARRLPILILAILLLPVMLFTGQSIPFDNTTERYFVEGDPTLVDFDKVLDLFGDNEYVIIGLESLDAESGVFTAEIFSAMGRLTEFLESHRYVTQVRSLINYQYIFADGDDLRTEDLVTDLDALLNDPALLERVRSIVQYEPLVLGTLISEDLQHARITARVEYRNYTAEHKTELAQELYAFIAAENLESETYALHLSGQALMTERFETLADEDLNLLIPLMALVMTVILYIGFRSPIAAILPWLVIAVGVLGVQEIQSYLSIPHSTVDQALLPTMIIIGIGISVHVLMEYFHQRDFGINSVEAAHATIVSIWKPALFTALTTSAGFSALSVTRIVPIREFALLGTIGPMLLFFFALTVLPALLSYVGKVPAKTEATIKSGLITRFADGAPDFTFRHRNSLLTIGSMLLVFAAFSLTTLRIDTNYVNLFKLNNPVRQDVQYFDRVFKGVMLVEILLDSGAAEGIKDPAFLRSVESFQQWLENRGTVGAVNSLVDFLKEINQALHGDDAEYYRLPDSPEMTAQFLLLYDSSGTDEDLSDIKDFDNRYIRLTVPIINMQATAMDVELKAISEHLDSSYAELDALLTGGMVLFNAQDAYSNQGMFRSFTAALTVMCVFFIFIFRSFKYGLLCIVPSVLPILLTGGIAGLAGVYLDLSTMMVGAMTMGIAVDDTIHVMNRYLFAKSQGASTRKAIEISMHEAGRAVIFSSAVLVFGFSVLTFASFVTIIQVGLFGAIIMFLALLGDLLFLPAILFWIDNDEADREKIDQSNSASLLV
jgi:uncharacterized protein